MITIIRHPGRDWRSRRRRRPARKSGLRGLESKPYGFFYSHGGGGRVRGPLEELLGRMGWQVGEIIESYGRPNRAVLKACHELGRKLTGATSE